MTNYMTLSYLVSVKLLSNRFKKQLTLMKMS